MTISLKDIIQNSVFPIIASGTSTLDFGNYPGSNEASIIISGQSTVKSDSIIRVYVNSSDTSVDHTANDHKYFSEFATVTSGSLVAGVGFTIYATSIHKLSGKFTVRWTFTN